MQDLAPERPSRRYGFRLRPVDACYAVLVMSAVGVFFVVYDDAGVEEAGAEGPEDGGAFAWLERRPS
jgi:hypothetical protein